MSRVLHMATTAGLLLWWAPTLIIAAVQLAPRLVSRLGTPYRLRRLDQLIARGDADEAERVIAARHRDRAASAPWLGSTRQ